MFTSSKYRVRAIITACVCASLVAADTAAAQTQAPTTPPGEPPLKLSGAGAAWFVVAMVMGILVLWMYALMSDRRRYYRSQRERLDIIQRVVSKPPGEISEATVKEVIRSLNPHDGDTSGGQPAPGSITSSLLALLTLTLVSLALAVVLVSPSGDAADLRKTITASLLSILATIAGFYFGAKTAQFSSTTTAPPTPDPGSGQGGPSPAPRAVASEGI